MAKQMKCYPVSWNEDINDLAIKQANKKGMSKSCYLRQLVLEDKKKAQ
jgi:hypothetical protein